VSTLVFHEFADVIDHCFVVFSFFSAIPVFIVGSRSIWICQVCTAAPGQFFKVFEGWKKNISLKIFTSKFPSKTICIFLKSEQDRTFLNFEADKVSVFLVTYFKIEGDFTILFVLGSLPPPAMKLWLGWLVPCCNRSEHLATLRPATSLASLWSCYLYPITHFLFWWTVCISPKFSVFSLFWFLAGSGRHSFFYPFDWFKANIEDSGQLELVFERPASWVFVGFHRFQEIKLHFSRKIFRRDLIIYYLTIATRVSWYQWGVVTHNLRQ
jgi:hypothetical protein